MRKYILLIIFILFFSTNINALEINGFVKDVFTGTWKSNKIKLLAGGVISIAVHEASHWVVLEAKGIDNEFAWINGCPGFKSERYDDAVALAGLTGQLGINTILVHSKYKNSDFVKGYTLASSITLLSYPFRHRGYGDLTDKNGDFRYIPFTLFGGFVIYDLIKIEW